ncbi:dirigent protein 21 [Phtheirospermum japonicum]|uniref:Dirigent protein n=1 Tax=Phtheirospermum japonicum TaxID=374723 RepID=A0A830BSN6_9LAMI|nr:dirigent protein 21 [Phtheirospermum japonicum]
MGKQFVLFMLFSIAVMAQANGFATKKWFPNIFKGKEKVTQLQLYVQDILHGPRPSTIPVAMANSTSTSPTLFGLLAVLDDPVRTGPTPDAEIVGRAQGLFAYVSLEEISIHMTFDLVFTSGVYNGSTLNLLGRNPYPRDYRELSVVGGSGAFRLARGFVGVRTVSFNRRSGDVFFQYNITVSHY